MVTQARARSWTTPGAQNSAQDTYAAIRTALSRWAPLRRYTYETFLQGSYANHTNTRGDSDVDVVVMLTSTFQYDSSQLNPLELLTFESAYPGRAGATITDFRRDVTAALVDYFGTSRVKPRNKCIRVDKDAGYVDADVVPAYQYRRHLSFPAGTAPTVIEGIAIHPQSGGRVINYPKEHIKNGVAKNASCQENYKPAVRQVKRLRRTAVDADLLGPKDAPGYLLECMTWNAPRQLFVADDLQRLHEVVTWLSRFSPLELYRRFKSCDDIHHRFIDDPGGHDAQRAHHVVQVLRSLLQTQQTGPCGHGRDVPSVCQQSEDDFLNCAEGQVLVHAYSTESSHARLYSLLTTVAVVIAIAVNAVFEHLTAVPPWLVSAPTLGAVFVGLLDWVEKHGWRREWLRRLAHIEEPNVAGLYRGSLVSTWKGATTLPVEVLIEQRWSRLVVHFKVTGNESSSSFSIAAALVNLGNHAARLTYAYRNQPNPGIAKADMGDHDGTAEVTITTDGTFAGRYYNFRGRQGTLRLTRTSAQT